MSCFLGSYFALEHGWSTMLRWFQVQSRAEQPDIHMEPSPPNSPPIQAASWHWADFHVLYSRSLVIIRFKYSSVYLSILYFLFLPPPRPHPYSWASQVVLVVKNSLVNTRDTEDGIQSLGWKDPPGEGNVNPLPCSCLKNPHGQKSLVGYSPWDRRVIYDWATEHACTLPHQQPWVHSLTLWVCFWFVISSLVSFLFRVSMWGMSHVISTSLSTYCSQCDTLEVHSCCYKWHYFVLFNGWVICHTIIWQAFKSTDSWIPPGLPFRQTPWRWVYTFHVSYAPSLCLSQN